MRKIIPIIILLLVLWASCSRTAHQPFPSYRLTADTLRQGGLELLHNIAVVDGDGRVLFTDSTEDYEPGRFSVVVPDSAQPAIAIFCSWSLTRARNVRCSFSRLAIPSAHSAFSRPTHFLSKYRDSINTV